MCWIQASQPVWRGGWSTRPVVWPTFNHGASKRSWSAARLSISRRCCSACLKVHQRMLNFGGVWNWMPSEMASNDCILVWLTLTHSPPSDCIRMMCAESFELSKSLNLQVSQSVLFKNNGQTNPQ